jgi:hypothetical protein
MILEKKEQTTMLHYFNGSLIEPIINDENISDVALMEAIFSLKYCQ